MWTARPSDPETCTEQKLNFRPDQTHVFSPALGTDTGLVKVMLTRDVDAAAITDSALCKNVGGVWHQPECSVSSQLACTDHGGQWQAAEQWTLKGGVDLLIVGLLQVTHSACWLCLPGPHMSACLPGQGQWAASPAHSAASSSRRQQRGVWRQKCTAQ